MSGCLGCWILGSFAFPILLFDRNAASENEPKFRPRKKQVSQWFLQCFELKGSACRSAGGDRIIVRFLAITAILVRTTIINIMIIDRRYASIQHRPQTVSAIGTGGFHHGRQEELMMGETRTGDFSGPRRHHPVPKLQEGRPALAVSRGPTAAPSGSQATRKDT